MKNRWISLILGIVMMISTMTPMTLAEGDPTLPELQYVIREGQGNMAGITRLEFETEKYLSFYRQGGNTGLMDLNGNVLVEGRYSMIEHICGDLFSLRSIENDLYALYRGGEAITTHRFSTIQKGYSIVRGMYSDGRIEYFDFNGDPCVVPDAPIIDYTQYQIFDYTSDQYLFVRYRSGTINPGNIPVFRYRIINPDGELIRYISSNSPVERVTEGLFKTNEPSYYYYNIQGERAFGDNVPGCEIFLSPDKSTFILHYKENDISKYRVYDKWVNPLFDIDAVNLDRITNLVINYIDDDKILYQKSDREYVVINTKNEILRTIEGQLITLSYEPEEDGKPYTGASAATGIGFLMLEGNNCHFYRSDLEGDFLLPGYCRVYAKQKLLRVFYPDMSEAVYDLNGKELIHGEGVNSVFLLEGILGKVQGGRMILCTMEDEVIADREYNNASSFGVEGIVRCNSNSRGGVFFLTHSGRELNDKAFEEVSTYSGCKTVIYKNNGKYGLVRIYTGEGDRFLDVPADAWYRDGAEFCAQKGIFNGTEAGRFSPENTMTRAMLVTVLWRLEGCPAAEGSSFSDVPEGLWYSTAVQWAAENVIVNGVGNDRFDPNGNVTREQIATILCRYARSKGEDTNQTADLSGFSDAFEISDYAKQALTWAYAEGLINGVKSNGTITLQPQGDATRAQVAAILMRYIQA